MLNELFKVPVAKETMIVSSTFEIAVTVAANVELVLSCLTQSVIRSLHALQSTYLLEIAMILSF